MEFKEVTYRISDDVALIVYQTNFHGHPIIQTKRTRVQYKDKLFEFNRKTNLNKAFSNVILSYSLRVLNTVELVNYLNRLINHDNLYQIYENDYAGGNENIDDVVKLVFEEKQGKETRSSYGARLNDLNNESSNTDLDSTSDLNKQSEESSCASAARFNDLNKQSEESGRSSPSRFSNLFDEKGTINLETLNSYRSPKYPLCISSIDELDYVPVYTFVHPKLLINQQSTMHLMHLAVLFKCLSRLQTMPEFSSQTSMSMLNITLSAHSSGITTQQLNESKYEKLMNKKKLYKKKWQEALDEIKRLSKKIDALQSTTDDMYNMEIDMKQKINEICYDVDAKVIDCTMTVDELEEKLIPNKSITMSISKDQHVDINSDEVCVEFNNNKSNPIYKNNNTINIERHDELIKVDKLEEKMDDIDKDVGFIGKRFNSEELVKLKLLQDNDNLHILVNKYNRRVYALVDNVLTPLDKVKEAYTYKWFYRYSTCGCKHNEISYELLITSTFTNKSDPRIKYE